MMLRRPIKDYEHCPDLDDAHPLTMPSSVVGAWREVKKKKLGIWGGNIIFQSSGMMLNVNF